MKKILIVARWEYLTTVMRGSFLFAVVAMPVIYGGMFGLAALAGRSASNSSGARLPAALVDLSHTVDIDEAARRAAERDRARQAQLEAVAQIAAARSPAARAALNDIVVAPVLVGYDNLEAALEALRGRRLSAVYFLEADYVETGRITSYTRDNGLFASQNDTQRRAAVADAVRAGLMKAQVDQRTFTRAFTPIGRVTRKTLDRSGQFTEAGDALGSLAGPFGLFMLLTMSIFFSAGFLQQATIADRANRMIEILLSSVSPRELVLGKLLGLAGAGLTQVALYLALIVAPGAMFFALFQVPLASLLISLVFLIVGYMMFACLMTATGMLGRTAQESAQISTIWIMLAAMPWFFVANISQAPNGLIARAMSFFPLTSAVTMMMRVASTALSPVEVVAVVAADALAIYLIVRAAARIFRAASLMYGKRATLPELVRWLRAA